MRELEAEKHNAATEIRQAVVDAAMKFLNKYSFPLERDGSEFAIDWQKPCKKLTSIFSSANQAEFEKVTSNAVKKYVPAVGEEPSLNELIRQGREEAISVYIALTKNDIIMDANFLQINDGLGTEMRQIVLDQQNRATEFEV